MSTTRIPITNDIYSTSKASLSTTTAWGGENMNDGIARSWNPAMNNNYRLKLYFVNHSGSFTNDTNGQPTERWGMYYNYYSVTAGTGTASTTVNISATESVCPAGFMMPKGQSNNNADPGTGSFCNILKAYGIVSKCSSVSGHSIWTLYTYPISIVPTGWYDYHGGTVSNSPSTAYYSTGGTGSSQGLILTMTFRNNNLIEPGTGAYGRGHGFSVRCVSS